MTVPDVKAVLGKGGLSSLPGWVHPVLWDQPGVAEAVRAVEEARAEPQRLRSERVEAHRAWQREVMRAVGKRDAKRPEEPPRELSHQELAELRRRAEQRELELGAVLVARAGDVLAEASERELDLLAEVRAHVEALQALATEVKSLGRAVNVALTMSGRGRRKQPLPSVDDLIWLAGKGEDVALLDFGDPGDKRTRWLQATGRG